MKVYYLRFTEDDFTKSGSVWTTPVIDLYNNSQYKNYSITKSGYGLNSLGNGTWTGLGEIGLDRTDAGVLESNRFIDTTGRIDIVDWSISYQSNLLTNIPLTLGVYTSEGYDNSYLGDWGSKTNLFPGYVIFITDSPRYAFFQIDWNVSSDISENTCELFVRIEIDSPGVTAYFAETMKLQNKLPEWMAMREYDPEDPLNELKATPESIGGKFLNAVAGEWLSDIKGKVTYTQFQSFIETVDLTQKAWVYQTNGVPVNIYSIEGDGIQLARVSSIGEFYTATDEEDVFFWNEGSRSIFSNKNYTSLIINGDEYPQSLYQVWNVVDDIGVTVDLFRLRSETNENFKYRILDVYKNRPGVSPEAFKKALRRELNLWKYYGATPNQDYLGATPEVLELSDLELNPEFFDYDGMPTDKFLSLVDKLAVAYPMTWGYFKFGKAFWDSDGLDHEGFQSLPRRFDATPVGEGHIDSGVGDGNDLYIMKPGEYTGAREFTAKFKIRGRSRQTRLEYTSLVMEANIYGLADDVVYSNDTFTGNYTLELTIGGVEYYYNFTMTAKNNQNYWQSTPSFESYATFSWLNENLLTNYAMVLRRKSNDAEYVGATPSQAAASDITEVTIEPGHWSVTGATYEDAPSSSDYRLWFSDNNASKMGQGGGSFLTISNFDVSGRNPLIVLESLHANNTGTIADAWRSTPFRYSIRMNGAPPANGVKDFVIGTPQIPWPSSTSNRRYVVEVLTSDGSQYGAYTESSSGADVFVPVAIISVNGSSTWTSGTQSFSSATTTLTFSTGTNASYPTTAPVWAPFEATQIVPFSGTVDENGPWRHGEPQFYGNTSYVLDYFNLNRSDFNVPNTGDFMVTWIGISDVSDSQIIVWTETNTVKPLVVDPTETHLLDYPENSIEEEHDVPSGEYQYNSVVVKARYKPGVVEEWYPKAYSGYFYDDVDEYYMYADRQVQSATSNYTILPGLNRLGAPVIVQGMRTSTPSTYATPATNAGALTSLNGMYDAYTTGLSDGSPVSTWIDSSTDANHISAASAGERPTLTSNQFPTGLPGVSFDGVDKYLGGSAVDTPLMTDLISKPAFEVYTVFKVRSISTANASVWDNDAIWCSTDGNLGLHVSNYGGTNRLYLFAYSSGSDTSISVPISLNTAHIAIVRYESGIYYLSVDGQAEVSTTFGEAQIDGGRTLIIGKNYDAHYAGIVIGEIDFYDVNHLMADRAALYNALEEKWVIVPQPVTTVSGELRQVYLWPNDATPSLGHQNTEFVSGTGTNILFAAYDDIYDISVTDITMNEEVILTATSSGSNQITTLLTTDRTHLYELTYTVARSFYVENEFIDTDKSYKSYVHFDNEPSSYGFDHYDVYYEGSKYDPATPINVPLNTFYTSIDEGFIYIDHDVHELSKTELRIDPGKIMADGYDYALVTLRTYDIFGNPKPYKTFNLYTNFGVFDRTTVTTDRDGFAYANLQSYRWGQGAPYPTYAGIPAATPNLSGSRGGQILVEATNIAEYDGDEVGTAYTETIDGGISSSTFDTPSDSSIDGGVVVNESPNTANVSFSIYTASTPDHQIAAIPSADQVPANNVSEVYIYGQIKDSSHRGVPNAVVHWRKDRFLYDLFRKTRSHSNGNPGKHGTAGKVVADTDGRFRIGPFVSATPSDPGTWMVSIESDYATPISGSTPTFDTVGDIVYWYEYTDTSFGVENIHGVPKAPVQLATPSWNLPRYSQRKKFPVRHDENQYQATPEDPGIIWQPPKWYSMNKYKQYQLGILGEDYWALELGATPNIHPDYKEF